MQVNMSRAGMPPTQVTPAVIPVLFSSVSQVLFLDMVQDNREAASFPLRHPAVLSPSRVCRPSHLLVSALPRQVLAWTPSVSRCCFFWPLFISKETKPGKQSVHAWVSTSFPSETEVRGFCQLCASNVLTTIEFAIGQGSAAPPEHVPRDSLSSCVRKGAACWTL